MLLNLPPILILLGKVMKSLTLRVVVNLLLMLQKGNLLGFQLRNLRRLNKRVEIGTLNVGSVKVEDTLVGNVLIGEPW